MSRHLLGLSVALFAFGLEAAAAELGVVVTDQASRQPVPARIHLTDAAGKAVRPDGFPSWHDHFTIPGRVELSLPAGDYTYEIERGPEFTARAGAIKLRESEPGRIAVDLPRLVEMSAEGWWSGELHIHRPPADIELLMRAEDLHIGPVITWWNNRNLWLTQTPPTNPLRQFDGNRFLHLMAGEDEREGGALLYFNLREPLAITGSSREFPSPMKFLVEARRQAGLRVDIEKPFWWDLPVWLASGLTDTLGIANNHMNRSRMYESEAWGRPRDARRLPPPQGNGYWTQEIYYHVLNSGWRVPPSAGSASGVLPNPVGYNRVYVQLDGELTWEKWWSGLVAGRSFVTSGPLLRVRADGQLPGHVFRSRAGEGVRLPIEAVITSRDPVRTLEIIKDGRVEQRISLTAAATQTVRAQVQFERSGWFLLRTIVDNPKTFRFASTAPFYVEVGDSPKRISRGSVQFFLDWLAEREARVKLADASERSEVLRHHAQARETWRRLLGQANAD